MKQTTEHCDSRSSNQKYAHIPPFSWMGSLSPLLLLPMLTMIVLGTFAPDNVLDAWPIAKSFTRWTAQQFDWIGNHAQSTSYPQVALLIACTSTWLFMWMAFISCVQSFVNYPILLNRQKANRTVTWKQLLIVFACIPLFIGSLIFAFALPGDPSWANGFTTSGRGGLIFLCCGLLYGCGIALGGVPLMLRLLIDLDLRKVN